MPAFPALPFSPIRLRHRRLLAPSSPPSRATEDALPLGIPYRSDRILTDRTDRSLSSYRVAPHNTVQGDRSHVRSVHKEVGGRKGLCEVLGNRPLRCNLGSVNSRHTPWPRADCTRVRIRRCCPFCKDLAANVYK